MSDGIGWINLDFLTGKLSTQPERAGIMGAILGTFWLMLVVAPVTMFLGVGTAIYLELYAKKGRIQALIQTNISNLAGVPSIVYGILGLTVFLTSHELREYCFSRWINHVPLNSPDRDCCKPGSHSCST